MPHGVLGYFVATLGMTKQPNLITLTEEQRVALQVICRRRKVDALVWKRARAFLLLDAGYDAKAICDILDIGPTVLTEWKFAFAGMGLSFFWAERLQPASRTFIVKARNEPASAFS